MFHVKHHLAPFMHGCLRVLSNLVYIPLGSISSRTAATNGLRGQEAQRAQRGLGVQFHDGRVNRDYAFAPQQCPLSRLPELANQ